MKASFAAARSRPTISRINIPKLPARLTGGFERSVVAHTSSDEDAQQFSNIGFGDWFARTNLGDGCLAQVLFQKVLGLLAESARKKLRDIVI